MGSILSGLGICSLNLRNRKAATAVCDSLWEENDGGSTEIFVRRSKSLLFRLVPIFWYLLALSSGLRLSISSVHFTAIALVFLLSSIKISIYLFNLYQDLKNYLYYHPCSEITLCCRIMWYYSFKHNATGKHRISLRITKPSLYSYSQLQMLSTLTYLWLLAEVSFYGALDPCQFWVHDLLRQNN